MVKKINEYVEKNKRICNFYLSNCCFEYIYVCFILVEYIYYFFILGCNILLFRIKFF